MDCPTLGAVPSINHDLTLKVTRSGVTFLTRSRYKARYSGSKKSSVDINGKLYIDARDHKKALQSEGEKNKATLKRSPDKKEKIGTQSSANISTPSNNLSTPEDGLSTKRYRVHKREVRQRLLGYMNTQRGKKELYFWTVTFPKGTADDTCYKIYNIWLTSLRKYRMLREYLWVAERQENGTLHFHIAIPHKMPVQRANAMMQGTLKTFSKRGEIPFSVWQCSRYNGVDIAKHRTTRRVTNFANKKGSRALGTYLTKYVTKNDTKFSHLAWHNSRGYSALFTGVTFTLQEFKTHRFGFFLNRTRIFEIGDFAKFIPWLYDPPPLVMDHLFQLNSYIQTQLN